MGIGSLKMRNKLDYLTDTDGWYINPKNDKGILKALKPRRIVFKQRLKLTPENFRFVYGLGSSNAK